MRPRFLIYLSICVLIVVGAALWLRPKQRPILMAKAQETLTTANPLNSGKARTVSNVAHDQALSASSSNGSQTIVTPKNETPEQAKQEIESANVPVEFYGRFIDQDSNALPGVNIKVIIRHWIMADPVSLLAGSKDISLEQESGPDGRFTLAGATGDAFDIKSIQKDGYEVEPGGRSFGAVGGSYENPVIFKMWSTNIHEKLITGRESFPIVPDGRRYFINLTDGTISGTGGEI